MTDLTKERLAMGGITIQVLALVRTLSEVLRLKYVLSPEFTIAAVRPLMVGAMIAAATCWIAVILFVLLCTSPIHQFNRRINYGGSYSTYFQDC